MLIKNSLNDNFPSLPMISWVGSPIKVAIPPISEDKTSVITKGKGSNFNCLANNIDTGAISNIVVTLSKNAEHVAVTIESSINNFKGSPLTILTTFIANHWNTPVSDINETIIIIPINRSNISNLLCIVSKICSSLTIPKKAIANAPNIVA